MTKIRPITPAIKLVLRASLPRVAPTTLSWILVSSSGRAPIRRVDASSSASENFSKPPEIVHLPSVIALLIVGADTSLLSYTDGHLTSYIRLCNLPKFLRTFGVECNFYDILGRSGTLILLGSSLGFFDHRAV